MSFWGNKNVLHLTVLIVAEVCEYTENPRSVHFKWVHFGVCEFCFNKTVYFLEEQTSKRPREKERKSNLDIREIQTLVRRECPPRGVLSSSCVPPRLVPQVESSSHPRDSRCVDHW